MSVFLLALAIVWFSGVDGCVVHGRNAFWGTVADAPYEIVEKIRDFSSGNLLDPSTFIKFQVDYGYGDAEQIVFLSLIDTHELHCYVIDQIDHVLGKISEKELGECREMLESCRLVGPFPRNMIELFTSREH